MTERDTNGERTPSECDSDSDNDNDRNPDGDAAGNPPEADVSPCYQAYLERRDDRPKSCTIYSAVTAGAPEDCWIKAWGDGFVSRDDAR